MTAATVDLGARVAGALANLGTTPTAVANTLHNAGFTGIPGSPTACPVARYLGDADLGIDYVNLTPVDCIVYSGGEFTLVPVPAPVGQFMARFDVGFYGDLDERQGGEVR